MMQQYPLVFLLFIILSGGFVLAAYVLRNRRHKRRLHFYRGEMEWRQNTLNKIQHDLGIFLENLGGEWAPATTDGGELCYKLGDHWFILADNAWAIDGNPTDLLTFLTAASREGEALNRRSV